MSGNTRRRKALIREIACGLSRPSDLSARMRVAENDYGRREDGPKATDRSGYRVLGI